MTMFLAFGSSSAVVASGIPSTFRAHSISVYWKPPQVARKGRSWTRANSMPASMPSKLLYGLPGEAQRPSNESSTLEAPGSSSEGVGSNADSTLMWSPFAECCSESLVAWCERNSVLKSPRIPIRTASLTRDILNYGLWVGVAQLNTVIEERSPDLLSKRAIRRDERLLHLHPSHLQNLPLRQ